MPCGYHLWLLYHNKDGSKLRDVLCVFEVINLAAGFPKWYRNSLSEPVLYNPHVNIISKIKLSGVEHQDTLWWIIIEEK